MLRSSATKLAERDDVAVVALHVLGVGRDEVDRLLHLEDRLGARLAGLEADDGGQLEVALADPGRHRAQQGAALVPRRRAPGAGGRARRVDRLADDRLRRREGAAGDRVVAARVRALEDLAGLDLAAGDDVRQRVAAVRVARRREPSLELRVGLAAQFAARIRQTRAHPAKLTATHRLAPPRGRPHRLPARRPAHRPHVDPAGRRHAARRAHLAARGRRARSGAGHPRVPALSQGRRVRAPRLPPPPLLRRPRLRGRARRPARHAATPTGSSRTSTCLRSRRTRSRSSRGWRSSRGARAPSA